MKGKITNDPGYIYAPYTPVMFLDPDSVKGKIIDGKYWLEHFHSEQLIDTVEYFLKDNKWFRTWDKKFELEAKNEIILNELNRLLRNQKLEKLLS